MKNLWNLHLRRTAITGFLTIALAASVLAEEAATEKTQVLLDKVKKTELDRQVAEKQRTIDRLKEDLDKNKSDAEQLQQTMDTTANLITGSTEHLDDLSADRKRLQRDLALTIARIDAEKQRMDGLRNLSLAQGKSLNALNLHLEETEARSQLRSAEMQALAEGKLAPGDETDYRAHADLLKLRKSLAASELKTSTEEKLARDAMKVAAAKVQAADAAAAKVKKMAEEPADTKPEAVAEKPANKVATKATPKPSPKQTAPPKAQAVVPKAQAVKSPDAASKR